MAFCDDPTDPAHMTPEQRLAEVAAILAEGVLRLRRRHSGPNYPLRNPLRFCRKWT